MSRDGRAFPAEPAPHSMDADSRQWVAVLCADPPERDRGIERLHQMLVRIAHSEALRRSGMNGIEGPELEDLAHQAAADATMSILAKIEDFRGESRFTTWAYKFVIYEVSNKFGRHVWRRDGVRLRRPGSGCRQRWVEGRRACPRWSRRCTRR